ncbi:MAG: 1-acyl-sn-glycerol-3-phosphate acyltransferase [Acidobacteriia bacterium]|nr:1-acyl-sn-glycerol-3-phosphate acyltransferase [Terriglobia bacterium]
MIRAFFVTLVTFAYILIVGPPMLIHAWLTGNTDVLYRVGVRGASMALWLAGVRLEVHGLEKIPPDRAVIFMPNHQSNCDPPAIITILPPVLVMAKQEFFRVPVLGRGMRARGFIPVDRRNRERAIAAVEQAVAALKAGHSFLAFPEGTRSLDGRLQTFKRGVFMMAIKAGAPIVPISVSGGRKIMPKGEFVIRPGRVRITIHDPIPTAHFDLDERQTVIDLTRQAILTGLAPEEWPA